MTPTAVADLPATLSLSVWFETTKRLLNDAVSERDASFLRRAKIRMQDDDRFDALPIESQRELNVLYAQAVTVTTGWGAP